MKKKSIIAFIVAAAVILIIGLSSLSVNKKSMEERAFIEEGEKLYNQLCISCHGENGKGEGEGNLPGTALNNQDFLSTFSDTDLYNQIKEGRDSARMPEYGSILDQSQINQLVSFIRSWQTESRVLEAPTALDGNPLNGEKLYGLYCATCHDFPPLHTLGLLYLNNWPCAADLNFHLLVNLLLYSAYPP